MRSQATVFQTADLDLPLEKSGIIWISIRIIKDFSADISVCGAGALYGSRF
jgi:hypothetical protein